jgi:peptidoglycan LD-endopeptidase LytH
MSALRFLPVVTAAAILGGCHRGTTPVAAPPAPVEAAPVPAPRPRPVLPPRPSPVGPVDTAFVEDDLEELWVRQMMVPVEGLLRKQLRDNYSARRGNRIHGALDIVAPRGTPVVAADDHIIGRLSEGPVGGIVIYATDPEMRFTYYYAHLESYRRGLAVGDRIAKGSVIGYVGTTGNAPANMPHLHFQVMKRGVRNWWDGPSINPLPFFALDGLRPKAAGRVP